MNIRPACWRVRLIAAAACGAAIFAPGCAPSTILMPDMSVLPVSTAPSYADRDWAVVLRDYVRYGLVDYDSLAANRQVLERYYALLAVTGPASTPEQFPSPAHATAYYLNAYNALVIRAVLERYPVTTMYDLSMPRLEHDYQFKVDGRVCNLAAVEDEMLRSSDGDARTLLATCRAAMGTPRLPNQPYQATLLERQLAEAAAEVLDNPDLFRIDHAARTIYIWQLVERRQDEFVTFWKMRRRVRAGYLFNVLLELASPERRRAIQGAVGYAIRAMPFDRTLNRWSPDAGKPVAP